MRGLLAFILLSCCILSAFADDSNIRCREPEKTGLFNQCERIQVVSSLSRNIRAYSIETKTVRTFPTEEIFALEDFKNAEPKIGVRVAVSDNQHFRICTIKAIKPIIFDCTNSLVLNNAPNIRWYGLKNISHR